MDRYGIETIAESVYQSTVCPFMRERLCANGNEDCQKCVKEWFADHDKQIRDEVVDKMVSNLIRNSRTEIVDDKIQLIVTEDRIKLIAEQMKREQNK